MKQSVVVDSVVFVRPIEKAKLFANTPLNQIGGDQQARLSIAIDEALQDAKTNMIMSTIDPSWAD